jgi:hypothetical protein
MAVQKNDLGASRRGRRNPMRLIKMIGLAAVTAMAAMAFVGPTSASAANTQLCNSHGALTCGSAATTVGMLGTGRLLNSLVDADCHIASSATPLALANPQQVHVTSFSLTNCETDEGDGCEVTVTEMPLSTLNKTGLDAGTITATNGRTHTLCEDVIFSVDIECEYELAGHEFTVGAQHLTASETPLTEIGSDLLCPNNPVLDTLMETTANRYVLA